MATRIPLTQGHFTIVDDADAALVKQYRWMAKDDEGKWYATRHRMLSGGRWRPLGLHTFLTGYPMTDHINGNRLDNRRANLRSVTPAENAWNRAKAPGQSPFKGVSWYPRYAKWHARIEHKGRRHHLGYFSDEVDAALAYDEAARTRFGLFCAVNFPMPGERQA